MEDTIVKNGDKEIMKDMKYQITSTKYQINPNTQIQNPKHTIYWCLMFGNWCLFGT